jgi:hypothetical protein
MLTAANWKYGFYGSELSANTLNKRQVYKGAAGYYVTASVGSNWLT